MPNSDEIQKIITAKERRLAVLRQQAVNLGDYTPPHVLMEMQDLEAELPGLYQQAGMTPPPPLPPLPVAAPHPAPASSPRLIYAIGGLLVGLAVNVAGNLLAAAIQQKYFGEQFSDQSLWGLAIFAVGGSLVGLWLAGLVTLPSAGTGPAAPAAPERTITRLNALFSYAKLRGQGITLSDILLIGSKLDIDTRSDDGPSHH